MTVFEKIVTLIIESAEKREDTSIISRRRLMETKRVTEHLERLSEEFDGGPIEIYIEEPAMILRLSVTLPDIVCQNTGDEFVHELVSLVDSIKFSRDKGGDLATSFEIFNLWSS